MSIHPRPVSLGFFVERLARQEPVTYVRYGDGEFQAMLGYVGGTCDGQVYSQMLGMDLMKTLARPREYMYAVGPKAAVGLGINIEQFMRRRGLRIDWWDSETFVHAMLDGSMSLLIRELRKHRVMTIGPEWLRKNPAFCSEVFVEVPSKNAYERRDRIYAEIFQQIGGVDVLAFSAGPAAKILIYDLFYHFGHDRFFLDFGSVWDWMCGVDSRKYMRLWAPEKKAELLAANLGAP